MLRFENTEVVGLKHAIRGMRNPWNSWDKSDSGFCGGNKHIGCAHCAINESMEKAEALCKLDFEAGFGIKPCGKREFDGEFKVGFYDLELMKRLAKAGTDHRKFMRMIVVYTDITAPLFWLKEFDTYKVGTVRNSCSTMHTITDKEFELTDFSSEKMPYIHKLLDDVKWLNAIREAYLNKKETNKEEAKAIWYDLIKLLPSSFNQKSTVMLNYEVLANMYKSRKNHRLDEWHEFCDWIKTLPYSELITGEE